MDVRQALATRSQKMSVSSDGSSTTGLFSELLSSLSSSTIDKLKATFASLKASLSGPQTRGRNRRLLLVRNLSPLTSRSQRSNIFVRNSAENGFPTV